jgi:uncharacterized RDD family membrane protein YckC
MSQLDQTASFAIRESRSRDSAYGELDVLVGWRRALASAIDTSLLGVIFILLVRAYGSEYRRIALSYHLPTIFHFLPRQFVFWVWYPHVAPLLFFIVLGLAYFTLTEAAFGWTLGKCVLGLRVVDFFGRRPTLYQSLIRNGFRLLDAYPFVLPNLFGFVVFATNRRRQRVGDRVAGTLVVDVRSYQLARLVRKVEADPDGSLTRQATAEAKKTA